MKKQKLPMEKVGEIRIGTFMEITDPGYSSDAWCKEYIKDMTPGMYNCYVQYAQAGPYKHVATIRIVLASEDERGKSLHDRIEKNRSWRLCGIIGVDAGIAGFFDGEKPDYDDDEWNAFCEWMHEKDKEAEEKTGFDTHYWYIRHFPDTGRDGFWSSSGYGDSFYPVFSIHSVIDEKRMTTAVEIRFI